MFELGWPESILLCTDGFYRAVDVYGIFDDAQLIPACLEPGGVERVLRSIRAVEAEDPDCTKHMRFKPADDASAIILNTAVDPPTAAPLA
jgi:hypothetical protein